MNKDRLGVWAAVLLTFSITLAVQVQAATYYVDAVKGLDSNPGVNPDQSWKTLEKVNSTTFVPGDHILFKAGNAWTGQLHPKGSGSEEMPIIVDRYIDGHDEDARPLIQGRGEVTNVVYLYNQEYWEIKNLEITNYLQRDTSLKRGIYIKATNYGTVHHIHLQNLLIHDVNGDLKDKDNGGIFYEITGSSKPTKFDDFLIDGCHIYDVDRTGISNRSSWQTRTFAANTNWYPSTNVVIRYNLIERTGNNGLIVRVCDGALVEHNVFKQCSLKGNGSTMFPFNCDNTVVQYNEAYQTVYNPGDADASGFDSDYRCKNSIFQYNYSHDNDDGFMVVCCQGGVTRFNDGTVVRYNISQNDGGKIFRISGQTTNTQIYNNTIYVGPTMSSRVIWHKSWKAWPDDTRYYNNIFYNLGAGDHDLGSSTNNVFSHNVFHGNHPSSEPDDPTKITDDPRFIDPGSGGLGIDTLYGYKLQSDSSCIDSGRTIPQNDGLDYWGNPVPHLRSATDRGAHEYPGPKTAPLAQQASNPTPANQAIQVGLDTTLNWAAGAGATSHNVYFGTNPRPGIGEFQASQTQADFDPCPLKPLTTHYWRIDENNAAGTATGKLWSFTTEPIGYPIENVTATASSSETGTGSDNTVNSSGLDANDLHSREVKDMWLTSNEPLGAWIEYEFGKVYKLHEMWVWNYNETDESLVGVGFKDVTIEYSANGTDYTQLGTTQEFAQAPGQDGYAHNTTIDLSGVTAKYVKLTANSNFGGILNQYGLSEVRFFYIPVRARKPYPDPRATDVDLDVVLGWNAGREAVTHDVYLSTDEQAVIDGTAYVGTVSEASYDAGGLELGTTYYWRVDEVNEAETPTTSWQGDVWSFSTQENFEAFETGDFSRFPWEDSGNASWAITSWEKHSGTYSAQTGMIDHDESTILQVTLDCVLGDILFYCKVSSERGFDYLKFYIDGVEKGRWSGEEDWAEVSFSVTAGKRTFKWTYSKDSSVSEGDDTAWIDDIVFPIDCNTE